MLFSKINQNNTCSEIKYQQIKTSAYCTHYIFNSINTTSEKPKQLFVLILLLAILPTIVTLNKDLNYIIIYKDITIYNPWLNISWHDMPSEKKTQEVHTIIYSDEFK